MGQLLCRTVWSLLKILKTKLLYDPVIPLLGIYGKKLKARSQRDTYSPKFIAVLFTAAKRQNKPSVQQVNG